MAITEEQKKEFMKSDEFKEAVATALETETKGLKKKNDELIGKIKGFDELKDRLENLEKEKEELEVKAAKGDPEKLKEQMTAQFKKENDKKDALITKLNSQLEKKVMNDDLTQALVKAKVAPEHMDAVRALIKTTVKGEIAENDGEPYAKFDGKAVDEYVTGWAQTDVGKRYVLADNNSGGGSNGTNGNGKAGNGANGKKTMTRTEFDALSPMDKSKFSLEGVSLTD